MPERKKTARSGMTGSQVAVTKCCTGVVKLANERSALIALAITFHTVISVLEEVV